LNSVNSSPSTANTTGTQSFFQAGNEVYTDEGDVGVNFDVTRDLGLGLLKDVKFGARYNRKELSSYILETSIAGLDTTALSNELFQPAPSPFFGGEAPGAYYGSEWQFLNPDAVRALLFANGLNNPNNLRTSPYTGYIYRLDANGNLARATSEASTVSATSALYGLANFRGNVLGFEVGGNFGARYVKTELDGEGFSLINNKATPTSASSEYDNFLPSANLSVELVDNVYLRLAYSEAITRPNPAGFTPSSTVTESPSGGVNGTGVVTVSLPGTSVKPYTSVNYDAALEWYNRRGSLFSVSFFNKDVTDFISTRRVCPTDGANLGFGTLSAQDNGAGDLVCTIDADDREIRITETINFDSVVTLQGLEFAVQQNLGFLKNPILRGFGVQGSASFIDVGGKDPTGAPASVAQVSDQSYNLAGYWENKKFSARLAYNWRSEYDLLGIGSITGTELRTVKPRGQLDFISRLNVTDDLILDFRAFNILDVLYEEYVYKNEQAVRLTAYDGRTFSVSATYKF
jgi:TonB-dependent receptor